jgi:Carboxypeptidase regulatory-like domain
MLMKSFQVLTILLLFALVFTFVCTIPASADELYASIRGFVTDQSGAVMPGAKVVATNGATGVSKMVTSNTDGIYVFLQLPVGDYSVKIEKPGFKSLAAAGIHLDVNQVYALNTKMELGEVSQQITVGGSQVQVETSTPQRGDVVDANEIVDLPLIGRDWVNLQQLESGVVAASDGRGEFATNGSQATQNSFLINGTDTNDLPLNVRTVIPSADAIQEFRMVTNTINPEYGRNSGAVINTLIKSGTNSFHGDAFEFYRDPFLNTKDYFTRAPAQFHQNQFGATIGGPIWKNHSFFFFSYQGVRYREPQPGVASSTPVFSQADLNGTGLFGALSNTDAPIQLVGDNGTTYPANTTRYSTIFSAGTIPVVDINSISASLVKTYVPLPTNTATNTYNFAPIQSGSDNQYLFRIDQNLGKKDTLWGCWLQESEPFNTTLPFVGATLPGFAETNQQHFKLLILSWQHSLNDHMINELRAGYNRYNDAGVEPQNPMLPSSAGFNITPQDPAGAGLPVIDITGLFDLGFSQDGPQPTKAQTYDVTDNLSFTYGRHTMKAGFDMHRFEVDIPFYAENSGFFNFAGAGTYTTGNPGVDFLLGIPDFYIQESGGLGSDRAQEYYSYFQDQWKVKENLSVTYGIGWTIDTPLIDKSYNGHGMAAFYSGQQSTVFPNAPLGVVYSGDAGVHATGTVHTFRNWGPRAGFIYSPDSADRLTGGAGKTSIRGGFGIYYNRTEEEVNLQFQGVPPNSISTLGAASDGVGGSPSFANPFVDVAGINPSVGNPFPFTGVPSNVQFLSTNGNLPIWSGCCSTVDQNNVDPTSYNYNLTLERQLSSSMILGVGYVGSEGRHLEIGHPRNLVTNVSPCVADPTCNAGNQIFLYPGDFTYPGNVYGSIDTISNMGASNYNSLQVGLKKSMSHGLQFTANYTWSHALDNGSGFENSSFGGAGYGGLSEVRAYNPYLPRTNYGSSIYDARQRLVIGYVYQFPSLHTDSPLLSRATNGWTISGITTFQAGFPMDVVDSSDPSLRCYPGNSDFACMDVPNVVGSIQYSNGKGATHQWFSPSSFASAAEGTFGDAPRDLLKGPGINNWDFELFKDTNITESTRAELRIEFYNLFNRTQFLSPGAIVTDVNAGPSVFGHVFSDNGQPREIQLAAKFYF